MQLIMSQEEFELLRTSVGSLQRKDVNHVFNKIFGKDHIPEIEIYVNAGYVRVTIPENNSKKFFGVLKQHLKQIGVLMSYGFSVAALMKWKGVLKRFGDDMVNVFR